MASELQKREKVIVPSSNISERDGKIFLRLEMPGVRKEDIDIHVEDNELRVSGKRHDGPPDGRFVVKERHEGNYYRVYTLDETIDRERIEASMTNGILSLTLEVKETEKPRKIQIKAG